MEPTITNHEPLQSPQTAWLFDVDGVITNPSEKRITQPEILDEIIKRLKRGEPVGLNTGRPVEFITEQVLAPLEERIGDKSLLGNVFCIGEMGAVWITYDGEQRRIGIDEEVTVPQDLKDRIRKLNQEKYSDLVYFDQAKRTMITLELLQGVNIDTFHERRDEIKDDVRTTVNSLGYGDLRVEATNIAVDIQNSHVGKALGARRFVRMLEERGISPLAFETFGDSPSDKEMHEELVRMGKNSKFVFVGKGEITGSEKPGSLFDKGTLEYLQRN